MGLFTPAFQPAAILDLCRTWTVAGVARNLRRDLQFRSATHTRDRDPHGARCERLASHLDGLGLRHAASRSWRGGRPDSQCPVGPRELDDAADPASRQAVAAMVQKNRALFPREGALGQVALQRAGGLAGHRHLPFLAPLAAYAQPSLGA